MATLLATMLTGVTGCSTPGISDKVESGEVESGEVDQGIVDGIRKEPVSFVGESNVGSCEPLEETQPPTSYTTGAPVRARSGDDIVVTGTVYVSPTCQRVAGASVEFWYAAQDGSYDDLSRRGRVYSDDNGNFEIWVETPGAYTDDNGQVVVEHIHFWVSGSGISGRAFTVSPPVVDAQTAKEPVRLDVSATVSAPTGV